MSIGTVQESIPVWRELAKHPFDRGCVLLASALSRAADEMEKALSTIVRLTGELAHVSRSLAWQQDERIKAEAAAAAADYQVRLSVSDHDLQFAEATVTRLTGLLAQSAGNLDADQNAILLAAIEAETGGGDTTRTVPGRDYIGPATICGTCRGLKPCRCGKATGLETEGA